MVALSGHVLWQAASHVLYVILTTSYQVKQAAPAHRLLTFLKCLKVSTLIAQRLGPERQEHHETQD